MNERMLLIKPRIPLKHMKKNLTKIELNLKNNSTTKLFEIIGEFPALISQVYDSTINAKPGDLIIEINRRNVSRASAKSVRKIIKASTELSLTLYRPAENSISKLINKKQKQSFVSKYIKLFQTSNSDFKSLISCVKPMISNKKQQQIDYCDSNIEIVMSNQDYTIESKFQVTKIVHQKTTYSQINEDTDIDHGYASIPSSIQQSTTTSYSSLRSLKETHTHDIVTCTNSFKTEMENFLIDIQNGIEVYVRPSIVLNILSKEQCLDLYQNVEKLIPVTKFMLNIINSFDSNPSNFPNAESLKIVFASFKTYLCGMPNAVDLLGYLSCQNNNFILFLEKINDLNSLQIFDFIFMPFNFVCKLIDYIRQIELIQLNSQLDESSLCNKQKLNLIIEDLYEFSIETQMKLENKFQGSEFETIRVQIKDNKSVKQWTEALVSFSNNELSLHLVDGTQLALVFKQINNVQNSKNPMVIHLEYLNDYFVSFKFENEINKDFCANFLIKN